MDRLRACDARDIYYVQKTDFVKTACVIRNDIDDIIRNAASNGEKTTMVRIPKYYIGHEPYDWLEMAKYIVDQLREDGYALHGTYVEFYVSWQKTIKEIASGAAKRATIHIPRIKRRV